MKCELRHGPLDGITFDVDADITDLFVVDADGNRLLYQFDEERFYDETQESAEKRANSYEMPDQRMFTHVPDDDEVVEFLREFVPGK